MLIFKKVSKKYQTKNKRDFFALRDFSYSFNDVGFYCILGKSGSGKSTIANLASLIDSPSEGEIFFNNKKISCFNEKEINNYRSQEIGLIFQHYNLNLNDTVINNICIPRYARQQDPGMAYKDGKRYLKMFGFDELFYKKKASELSGGEAQRIAIIRAIINNPKIIIADEPTGALDEKNSLKVMQILKMFSKEKCIIVITHNIKLAQKFADEIIHLEDGIIKGVTSIKQNNFHNHKSNYENSGFKFGKNQNWMVRKGLNRLINNKGKNILTGFSILIGLVFVFISIGFSQGVNSIIQNHTLERFDYGCGKIYKIESINLTNSTMKLNKMTRLSDEEILNINDTYQYLKFELNVDAIFSKNAEVSYNGMLINEIDLSPVYNFDSYYCNDRLVIKGSKPPSHGLLVNKDGEQWLKKSFDVKSVIGLDIKVSSIYKISFYDDNYDAFIETYEYDKNLKIYGVVNEFSFLSTPKFYYSYSSIIEHSKSIFMPMLSQHKNQEIYWYDYLKSCSNNDEITSFSHRVFCPINNLLTFESIKFDKSISLESDGVLLKSTFKTLMDAVLIGLSAFSSLAIIGTVLIIGITSFSSYTFEKKNSAIYMANGVSKEQIFIIFIIETILVALIAFCLSIPASLLFEKCVNFIIFKQFNLQNLICIPFFSYKNKFLFLPLISLLGCFFIAILSTYLPLKFVKKINLKKELSEE